MDKFDELFEFRLARVDEVDKIMDFICRYWPRKNHILASDRGLFEYEFRKDDRLGYFLAIEKSTGNIAAAEGIYFYSSDHVPGETDMSSGMFLANPNCKVPFIGLELMRRKFAQLKPRAFVAPGVNMITAGSLYPRFLHQDVSRMKHFYILADREEYKIAKIQVKPTRHAMSKIQNRLEKIGTVGELYKVFDDDAFKKRRTYKDRWYVTHRYFEHPIYKYQVFLSGSQMAVIGREIEFNGAKILRIVDILGDASQIAFLGMEFRRLLQEKNYEYIDLYEVGMEDEALLLAGFTERIENDVNVIPNYFEPYECKNVDIYVQRLNRGTLCFRGDGDQDRPNLVVFS